MMNHELKLGNFAQLFGTSVNEIPDSCRDLIEQGDFKYTILEGEQRDRILVDVLKKIDSGQFSLAGKEGKGRWEKGWAENLKSFIEHGHSISQLLPRYIRPEAPMRLNREYIVSSNPSFEFDWYKIFRKWLFNTYLKDVGTIYEFGCGSGFNLAEMAEMYPEKKFYGLDWAAASKDIVDELGKKFGWNMQGLVFDFFSPDEKVRIEDNSAVLTIGAVEQTGCEWEPFLQYLLDSHPGLCIHVEPILEWYDEDNLIDYAAIRFHTKRKYWQGFPDRIKELEREGKVKILKTKRSYFGSLYIEGYSQIIWSPC